MYVCPEERKRKGAQAAAGARESSQSLQRFVRVGLLWHVHVLVGLVGPVTPVVLDRELPLIPGCVFGDTDVGKGEWIGKDEAAWGLVSQGSSVATPSFQLTLAAQEAVHPAMA